MKKSLPIAMIEGHLERITYFNPDNHYMVAKLKASKTNNMVTIVGYMTAVSPGQALKIKGNWETHYKYGQQFRIESYEITLPATIEGIRTYLASGIIKGVGPSMAARMVNQFGIETPEIIEKYPEKLQEISGIGKKTATVIHHTWKDHHGARDVMQFLQEMGVKTSYCARILKAYGQDAVRVIRRDPYRLSEDISGIGFYTADSIAMKLGVTKDNFQRIKACIFHVMEQDVNEGHVFTFENRLIEQCKHFFQLEHHVTRDVLDSLSKTGELVIETVPNGDNGRSVYLKALYKAEAGIANRIRALMSVPISQLGVDPEGISAEVQRMLAIQLSPEQLGVLEEILSHRVVIITGGPGTGKTTLIRSITAVFKTIGKRVLLAAPTGRAARRLSEVTGKRARTIHKLLGFNFKDNRFDKHIDNPLDTDAVIIDEASMVDSILMFHLVSAVPAFSTLILVGDVFQLPSVGPGNVLSDLIKSNRIPIFYLKKIFRQADKSPIVMNAHRVRKGDFPVFESLDNDKDLSEFYFVEQNDPVRVASTIVELCSKTIPERFGFDPTHEVQVLTPMHKGVIGTTRLNQILQNVLNPNPIVIETRGNTLKQADKVMHLRNNYQKEVFNGDIGTINTIHRKKEVFSVDYYGRIVDYDFTEMDEISLAYAISVHKSQGSEYPVVVLPMMPQHFVLLQRNLLYTAITRGKRLVIIVGTKHALNIALKNNMPKKRLSGLAFKLMNIGN